MIFIASIEFVDNNAERDLSMDIKNLETFVMVNELKSFTQAAQRLGFTQSTVSFQIKQLENELGNLSPAGSSTATSKTSTTAIRESA